MNSSDFIREAKSKLNGNRLKTIGMLLIILGLYYIGFLIFSRIRNVGKLLFYIFSIVVSVPIFYGLTSAYFSIFKGESVKILSFFEKGFSNFKKSWSIKWLVFLKMCIPIILFLILTIASPVVSYIYTKESAKTILNDTYTTTTSLNSNSSFYSMPNNENSYLKSSTSIFSTNYLLKIFLSIFSFALGIWIFCKYLYYSLANVISMQYPNLTSKQAINKSEELMTGNRFLLFKIYFSIIIKTVILLIAIIIILSFIIPPSSINISQDFYFGLHLFLSIIFIVVLIYMASLVLAVIIFPYIKFSTFSFYMYLNENNPDISDYTNNTSENININTFNNDTNFQYF